MKHAMLIISIIVLSHGQALAQHAGDIFVDVIDNQIRTGAVSANQTVTSPVHVFAAEFGDSGFPTFTANPGFFAFPATFQTGTRLGWDAVDAFQVWNGTGFEPTGGETLLVSFSSLDFVVGNAPVAGFDLAVQSDGAFHKHLSFFIQGDGALPPEAGVYLLNLEMYSTDPGLGTSDPFWIVFDYQAPGQHDAAIQWVVDHLAPSVCAADLNDDDIVNVLDLLELLTSWGACAPCDADLNDDGIVDVLDLLELLTSWGACP